VKNLQFSAPLSREFFKQLLAGTVFLDLAVQLVNVAAHRHQKACFP
jgi:hypothetical protein